MYKENSDIQNPQQNSWERIEAVIKMAQMTTNSFARHIGLPRGENLYQIKRGNNGVSQDVANRIIKKFPEISKLWLMTGEGQMFCGAPIGIWSHVGTPNSEAFLGFAAALVLPKLINKPECKDPYTVAVGHAKKLMEALEKGGGRR